MSPIAERLYVLIFIPIFVCLVGCETQPLWDGLSIELPEDFDLSPMELQSLIPETEELGQTIEQFFTLHPNAQFAGGDTIAQLIDGKRVDMQYSVYVVPGERSPVPKAQFTHIGHLFYAENLDVPRKHGRFMMYDSEIDPPPDVTTNHKRIMIAQSIKSGREPDESNVAKTSITTPAGEVLRSKVDRERRVWCPLFDKRMPSRCGVTKVATYDALFGQGQVTVVSPQLVSFFAIYRQRQGFEHPMFLKLEGKSWWEEAKTRAQLQRTDILPDEDLRTEQMLDVLAQAKGLQREHSKSGMASAQYYTEMRRIDEEARLPYPSEFLQNLVLHYLEAYARGTDARFKPDAYLADDATLKQRRKLSNPIVASTYLRGYADGLRGVLKTPRVITNCNHFEGNLHCLLKLEALERDIQMRGEWPQ